MNRVCEILNIKHPVIHGPMAWITSPELVAAVSNAGGLGTLGTSAGSDEIVTGIEETVEAMRVAIRKTKELTDKPFGVNVFPKAIDPYGFSSSVVEMMKEENVTILVVAGVVDTEEFRRWKSEGFTIIFREANPSVRGAIEAEKAGIDYWLTFLNGVAGRSHSHEHAVNSAKIFNQRQPTVVGAGGLTLFPGTELGEESKSGEFDPLSEKEMMEELKLFLENLECDARLITHHTVAMNLSGNFLENKAQILNSLQYAVHHLDEEQFSKIRHNKRTL